MIYDDRNVEDGEEEAKRAALTFLFSKLLLLMVEAELPCAPSCFSHAFLCLLIVSNLDVSCNNGARVWDRKGPLTGLIISIRDTNLIPWQREREGRVRVAEAAT